MGRDAEGSQSQKLDDLLQEGVAAAAAGEKERARGLLMRVVERDERNAQAWMWLSSVVESLEDREVCLENVLAIDPDNDAAKRGLVWVQQQMQAAAAKPQPLDTGVVESPVVQRTRTPNTPAAAILYQTSAGRERRQGWEPADAEGEAVASSAPETARTSAPTEAAPPGGAGSLWSSSEPERAAVPPRNEFADEYLCPYCTAMTEPKDRKCRVCGGSLWISSRVQERRSSWLWFMIALQMITVVYSGTPVMFMLFFGSSRFASLIGLSEVPRVVVYVLAALGLFSLSLALALYARWRPVYYLLMADALVGVVAAVTAFAFSGPRLGIALFLVALLRFVIILRLGGDFEWQKNRILFRPDRGLKSPVEYMTRADFYNEQKMWGLALIHIRAALGIFPNRLDLRLALIVAYMRIKRHDLATRALEQAKRIAPDDPRLVKMKAVLDEALHGGQPRQMTECRSCGASFLPEEAVDLDGATAQCPHCGAIVERPVADAAPAVG
jgi:tetratricopeptide (TPR) repeat protein